MIHDPATITVIERADWTLAFDPATGSHRYLRDADVAFAGDTVIHVGGRYDGEAAVRLDGRTRFVMPGLVNIHSHPASEPLRKGITDETESPGFHHSSLYEFLTVFDNDAEGRAASLRVALAELLLSGCTTMTDISAPWPGWLDTLAGSGIRAVVAPSFRDARWRTADGHSLEYLWDEDAGGAAFEQALRTIDLAAQHPCGRLSGMVFPAQVDTCTPKTLRRAHDAARDRGLPFQTHVAQSVTEFHEIFRRHGRTPIGYLADLGVLDDRSLLGHAIFLDHHPWLHWTSRDDLARLADSGATVAHCPTVFGRRGITLRSLGEYLRRGVRVGIGTDTYPHNLLDEMRNAMMYARVAAETVTDVSASQVMDAATLEGARALGRDDLGRIEVGARADLVLVDTHHPAMRPLREPVRSLLHVAAERAVHTVFVDGRMVVDDGRCLTIDLDAACEALEAAQRRSLARVPDLDWAGRDAAALAPMAYPGGELPRGS